MTRRLPTITIVRAYEIGDRDCGYRVLVDRLWPRGLKKKDLHLDQWAKDLAPSAELRKWFDHRPERWPEFQKKYRRELRSRSDNLEKLARLARRRRMALVYGARDEEHNHAIVLRTLVEAKRSALA